MIFFLPLFRAPSLCVPDLVLPLLHIYGMHKGILQEPDLDKTVTQVLLNVLRVLFSTVRAALPKLSSYRELHTERKLQSRDHCAE